VEFALVEAARTIYFSKQYILLWIGSGISLLVAGVIMSIAFGKYFLAISAISLFYLFVGVKVYLNPLAFAVERNLIRIYFPTGRKVTLAFGDILSVKCFMNLCLLKCMAGHYVVNLNGVRREERNFLVNVFSS
jgi:hypothetical protein